MGEPVAIEDDILSELGLQETALEPSTGALNGLAQSDATLHFTCKSFVLQALLEKAASVMPSKDLMPVLKHFQIEAREDRLRVVSTDLELSIIATSPVVTTKIPGTAVFPGRKMLDIIKESAGDDIEVDVQDGTANIACGRATWCLRLTDGRSYPDLPEIADIDMHKVNRVRFLGALHAVSGAAAQDEHRPALMMVDVQDGRMTACDGVRYQQADIIGKEARSKGETFPLDMQIPIAAVGDLVKLLRTTEQPEIQIGDADHFLVFGVGSDVFIANKLMAEFPDMEELLLKPARENKYELSVDRQELMDAVRRVRITSDPETSAIVLTTGPNQLAVMSRDSHYNEAHETINAGWTYDEHSIAVNHVYLTDMLDMADAKSCAFFLGDDTKTRKSPLVLKDPEADSIGIIGQMRIDWVT